MEKGIIIMAYFGTNGIRGNFDYVSPQLAFTVAQAVGEYFKRGKILVARDQRITGQALAHSVLSGLQSVGCDAIDLGIVASPTAEFMIKKLGASGLIIITASHLPPEFNAIKVVDKNGVTISRERGVEIEKLFGNTKPAQWKEVKNSHKYADATRNHIEAIKKLLKIEKIKQKKLKLAIDCANATACVIAPYLFRELGCEIITLNSNLDGHFPGRESEPIKKNLGELIEAVKAAKCDFGIAFDGDCDRVVLIDDKGEFVVGDRVFALSAGMKLKGKKGAVASTVATSMVVEEIAKKYGCKTIYTKIGAPYLSEKFPSGEAVIGGEEVGGVIWPELSFAKDGIFTAAKVAELVATEDKNLSALLDDLPKYYNEKTKIEANAKQKAKITEGVMQHAKSRKLKIIDIDGVRINMDDSWVIVRASGTEDYVRIFAESKSSDKAKKLVHDYKSLAESFRDYNFPEK